MSIPSAADLVEEAFRSNPSANVNAVQGRTYGLMIRYRQGAERKIDAFLAGSIWR